MIFQYAAVRTGALRRAIQQTTRTSIRRTHETTHHPPKTTAEPESTSQSSARTIPGPTWLWTEPLNSFMRVHSRRPYLTQFVSTIIVYLAGDLISQRISPSPARDDSESTGTSAYDPFRTMRALLIGGLAAIPGYRWFLYLAQNFNYSSKAFSVGVKVLINQMVFTPTFNCYFFGMQSLLTGATFSEIVERIQNTVPRSWINSWKVWPAAMAFSFAFIRVELRGLFAGVIAIGWQTYLSILNQRAARLEKAAREDTPAEAKSKRLLYKDIPIDYDEIHVVRRGTPLRPLRPSTPCNGHRPVRFGADTKVNNLDHGEGR